MADKTGLTNLKELNKMHREFLGKSQDKIADSIERTGIVFFQKLQILTPKEYGRARNGWIVKVDSFSESNWKPQKNLASYKMLDFPKGEIKFDSFVWISNNVEYIQYLDDGHSIQAKEGFTNDALRHTIMYLEREVSKLNRKRYV